MTVACRDDVTLVRPHAKQRLVSLSWVIITQPPPPPPPPPPVLAAGERPGRSVPQIPQIAGSRSNRKDSVTISDAERRMCAVGLTETRVFCILRFVRDRRFRVEATLRRCFPGTYGLFHTYVRFACGFLNRAAQRSGT